MARTTKQSAGSIGAGLAQATGAVQKEWAGKFVKGTTINAIREAYGAESGSMKATDASSGDVVTTALVRGPAGVNLNDLTWKTGATAAQKAKAKAQLLALGIKAV